MILTRIQTWTWTSFLDRKTTSPSRSMLLLGHHFLAMDRSLSLSARSSLDKRLRIGFLNNLVCPDIDGGLVCFLTAVGLLLIDMHVCWFWRTRFATSVLLADIVF